jgi:hypothetical protein
LKKASGEKDNSWDVKINPGTSMIARRFYNRESAADKKWVDNMLDLEKDYKVILYKGDGEEYAIGKTQ